MDAPKSEPKLPAQPERAKRLTWAWRIVPVAWVGQAANDNDEADRDE